jgi:hypothetical protein
MALEKTCCVPTVEAAKATVVASLLSQIQITKPSLRLAVVAPAIVGVILTFTSTVLEESG